MNMTLGPLDQVGYALGYHVVRESWHYAATSQVFFDETVLSIGMYSTSNGGCKWEFSVTEEDAGGRALRVRVFDEGWVAFTAIPEFFTGLADLGRGAGVEEVVEFMNSLGFTDFTQREQPVRR